MTGICSLNTFPLHSPCPGWEVNTPAGDSPAHLSFWQWGLALHISDLIVFEVCDLSQPLLSSPAQSIQPHSCVRQEIKGELTPGPKSLPGDNITALAA